MSQGEDGMSTDTDEIDDPDRLLLGGGTSTSSHMMEKFRGVRNEMRRRILHTRDIIGDGKVHVMTSLLVLYQRFKIMLDINEYSSSNLHDQIHKIF